MSFMPKDFTLSVDTIAGGSLRMFFYETQDTIADILEPGYAFGVDEYGAREGDIVLVYIDDPVEPQHHVTRIDTITDGAATLVLGDDSTSTIKPPVDMATTGNITLSGIQNIDGETGEEKKRVLVKDQDDAIENGIWVMTAGPWRRAKDFSANQDVRKGTLVMVTDGTENSNSLWYVTNDNPIQIGVTGILFERFIGEGELQDIVDEAQAFADKAQEWAENPVDVEVETGQFSSLHHAAKAALSASAAMLAGNLYDDTGAFEAATSPGDFGFVKGVADGQIFATYYENVGGTATDTGLSIPSYVAYALLAALIGSSDGPWEVRDALGNMLAHIANDETSIGGLVLRHIQLSSLEVQDPLGYVSVRLDALTSMINGFAFLADVPGATEIHDLVGYIIARFQQDESMINGVYFKPGGNELEIQDQIGYILWRAGLISTSSGGGSEPTQPSSTVPILGPCLYGVKGEPTALILDNLLDIRNDAGLCQATIQPEAGRSQPFEHSVLLDVGEMGAGATLAVRPRIWDGVTVSELPIEVRAFDPDDVGPATPIKIAVWGDSIPTYQGLYWQDVHLTRWGFDPVWIGTCVTDGNIPTATPHRFANDVTLLGETKPGHELADATYALTTTVSPLAPGSEAAYAGMTLSNKRLYNTALIAQDGSYPAGDVRNGYVIDFDWYFTRHGLDPADVFEVIYGTNDIKALTPGSVFDRIYSEMSLLHRRWREHDATKPMVITLPGTGRSAERDTIWATKYSQAIRALFKVLIDAADPNLHLVPVWAHAPSDTGYDMEASVTSPDPITGVTQRQQADDVHPTDGTREEIFRMQAAGTAYAFTHIV